jgi:hypothetical protein
LSSFNYPRAEEKRKAGHRVTVSEETVVLSDLSVDPPDIAYRFLTCPKADHSTVDVVGWRSTPAPRNLPKKAASRTMSTTMPGMVVAAPARVNTPGIGRTTGSGRPRKTEAFQWQIVTGDYRCLDASGPVGLFDPSACGVAPFPASGYRGNLLPKSIQHHSLKLSKIHEPPCSHGVSAPSALWSEEATNTGLTSPGCAALSGFLNLSVLYSSP